MSALQSMSSGKPVPDELPEARIAAADWQEVEEELGRDGCCARCSRRGDAVVLAVRHRLVASARASLRHGVGPLRRGLRHTLGIIFHDARSSGRQRRTQGAGKRD